MMKFFNRIFKSDFWIEIEEDPVCPSEEEQKKIQQKNLLTFFNASYSKQLLELKDDPEKPREVFHYFYFIKTGDFERFKSQIIENEFITVDKFSISNNGKYKIGSKIMRIDKTDKINIANVTQLLWKLALKNNGFYKGWETTPVK